MALAKTVRELLEFNKEREDVIYTVSLSDTCQQASQQLTEHNVSAICIIAEASQTDRPVLRGIVTERDFARLPSVNATFDYTQPVTALMSSEPISVTMETGFLEATELMAQHHVRHLPVVERQGSETILLTTISQRDIAGEFLRAEKEAREFAEEEASWAVSMALGDSS